jgi:membrane fusion protein, multidrug efflux system
MGVVAVLDDLQEVAALFGIELLGPPVVENEEINASQAAQQLGIAAVAAGEREGCEQSRHSVIENREVLPAGFVTERAGEPTFANAARAGDQQIAPRADKVEARLGSARLQIDGLKATYRQQLAELQSAKDSADFDAREYARKKALVASDWVPRAVYERAETDLKVARQRIASIGQQIANTVVALSGDPNIELDRHPTVRAAKAQLDRARLDLSYATVVAPEDGIVTRVDDLQVGDFVNPGASVIALLSSRRIWVEANFRETGLTHMRPGQEATIDVDVYPDRRFRAHVVSMSPGTGSDFAVLPPENATGNWVKVVQRLPVRLELDEADPNRPLFSGISVTARVDTGYRRTWCRLLQPALATEAK